MKTVPSEYFRRNRVLFWLSIRKLTPDVGQLPFDSVAQPAKSDTGGEAHAGQNKAGRRRRRALAVVVIIALAAFALSCGSGLDIVDEEPAAEVPLD